MFSVSPLRTAGGAIVGLQNVTEIVIVDGEEPRVGGVTSVAPFVCECRVAEADAIPPPAVGLEHSSRGRRRDEREIVQWAATTNT